MNDMTPPTEESLRERLEEDSRPHREGDTWKWVKFSTELLASFGEWSEPVQIRINREVAGMADLEIRRVQHDE